jgi:hypothetical protein
VTARRRALDADDRARGRRLLLAGVTFAPMNQLPTDDADRAGPPPGRAAPFPERRVATTVGATPGVASDVALGELLVAVRSESAEVREAAWATCHAR